MNKNEVNRMLPKAVDVLEKAFPNKEIQGEYRGYISNFGASVMMGSLAAAVAFNSDKSANSKSPRYVLMDMILELLKESYEKDVRLQQYDSLFSYVKSKEQDREIKERVINASIAIKLGIGLFKIKKD